MIKLINGQFVEIINKYPFLEISFAGNKIGEYIAFFLFFFLFFSGLRIFRVIVLKKIKKIIEKIGRGMGGILVSMVDSFKPGFYWFLSFYASINILNLDSSISRFIDIVLLVWIAYQVVKIAQILIDYGLSFHSEKEKEQGTQNALSIMGMIVKGILWVFAALFILSNLGINVTSLMVGLGIGGIAIALAIQNILNDLFSSFAIYFDKPFVPGDFIIVGEHMGTVEKIGIKTTRLKALQGEEVVISNKELTTARIQNFKKMRKRRIVFNFGVTYDTPLKKLEKINLIVTDIVEKEKLSEFERVHFTKFNDFSLDFEVVYHILSGNYKDYMDTHQSILFQIKESFEKEKVSMAFPTQTIHVEK